MSGDVHRLTAELEVGLESITQSPSDQGAIELIVCRPSPGVRAVLEEGELDAAEGLVGDSWRVRGSSQTSDGAAHPAMQLTLMNSRVADLVACTRERWPLAGDQLFVDLDLSVDSLPPGTRLAVGSAVVEISELPHAGCRKFTERFGLDAMRFVNSPAGKRLRLRGVNAMVVHAGTVHVGDVVRKLDGESAPR